MMYDIMDDEDGHKASSLSIVYDDDDDGEDNEDGEPVAGAISTKRRVSLKPSKMSTTARRCRRRSSARFLKLSTVDADEGQEDDDYGHGVDNLNTTQQLGEVYRKAIRMNAENRINASNSWNLSLIDHLDRFLTTEVTSLSNHRHASSSHQQNQQLEMLPSQTVNFTKASCTLDASVKIYSYRVDDVHLTSYKVLANLNRTETGKQSHSEGNSTENPSTSDPTSKANRKNLVHPKVASDPTDTLEHNVGT